jgi:hypothetical protein
MDLAPDFVFQPQPPLESPTLLPFPAAASPLGPLAGLLGDGAKGHWTGRGFNTIWRPNHTPPGQDRFLELNLTIDEIDFTEIQGQIPNRGLLQPDIAMFGLTYLQQISDANLPGVGLHAEPGVWATVPRTTNPNLGPTVARLASIPHGTTILAQGTASTAAAAPNIPAVGILPFTIGSPSSTFQFPEQILSKPTQFRTSGRGLTDITQAMVDNPNSVLHAAIAGQHITSTTTLEVSTGDAPIPGGGTANTAFLHGAAAGPNANAASVKATFWLETVEGQPAESQLQYSQTVLLNFNGLSWPHVTVGTLRKS